MNRLLTIAIIVNNHDHHTLSLLKKFNELIIKLNSAYEVEIVIVYNTLNQDLVKSLDELSCRSPYIRLYKTLNKQASITNDISSILENCNGTYIWFIEEDYLPLDDSLEKLCPILFHNNFSLLLFNIKLYDDNKYINTTSDIVSYDNAISLFYDFGLTSITKISSCFIFSKNDFSASLYNEYMNASLSHGFNFALLDTFYNKTCAFISEPILVGLKKIKAECFFNFTNNKIISLNNYIKEILKLTFILTNKSKFNPSIIFSFNEILISDDSNYSICNTYGSFILDMVLKQLEVWIQSPKDFTLEVYNSVIEQFLILVENTSFIFIDDKKRYKKLKYRFILLKYCQIKKIKSYLENFYSAVYLCSTNLKQQSLIARQDFNFDTKQQQNPVVLYCNYINHIRLLNGQGQYTNGLKNQVLLSILIPSYNRGYNLDETLQLIAPQANYFKNKIEIVIALNACTDHSFDISSKHAKEFSFIKVKNHDVFVQTAEENISRSISLCSGLYIWTLGDDDIVLPEVFILLVYLVEHNKNVPAILFNHAVTTKSSNLFSKYINSLVTNTDNLSLIKYQNLVTNYGLTTSMAFISRYIIHKDYFHEFNDYINISPIYSHVFSFLEAFYDKSVLWVNYPLVTRYDSDVDERINTIATNLRINKFHLWSGGIIKLYLKLCEKVAINKDFFFHINETNQNQSYALHIEVMQNIIRQYALYVNNRDCLPPSPSDIMLYEIISNNAPIFEKAKLEYLIDKIIKLDSSINQNNNHESFSIKKYNQEIEKLTIINIYSRPEPFSKFQNLDYSDKNLEKNIRISIYKKILYHYRTFGIFQTVKKILKVPYDYLTSQ